jgi:hypothetical protein
MMKFADLYAESMHLSPGEQQGYVLSNLPSRIEIKIWRPSDRIHTGKRILFGVSFYVPHDLKLLDSLRSAFVGSNHIWLDVFLISDCNSHEDFCLYVPGLGKVFQPPVVGIWENGVLVTKGSGWEAKKIVELELGKESKAILRHVQSKSRRRIDCSHRE